MCELSNLVNIGPVLEQSLQAAGIKTQQQLFAAGSREAFLQLRLVDNGACLHALYALEGAIEGIRYTHLSEETKRSLKEFFQTL